MLCKIVHVDPKSFNSGKFTRETTRLTFDLLPESEYLKKDGMIMTIDFVKSFEMVSWDLIQIFSHFSTF